MSTPIGLDPKVDPYRFQIYLVHREQPLVFIGTMHEPDPDRAGELRFEASNGDCLTVLTASLQAVVRQASGRQLV